MNRKIMLRGYPIHLNRTNKKFILETKEHNFNCNTECQKCPLFSYTYMGEHHSCLSMHIDMYHTVLKELYMLMIKKNVEKIRVQEEMEI